MGVSVRVAGGVLLSVLALLPRPVEAAPIIIEQTIADPLTSGPLEGTFTFDNDVALFHFFLEGPGTFTFAVSSTSAATGFDPILTLFDQEGALVTFTSPDGGLFPAIAFGETLDSDAVLLLTLAGGFSYTLAVTQFGPAAGNFAHDTLQEGFDFDAAGFSCFTFIDPADPLEVPEGCVAGAEDLFGGSGQSGLFSLDLIVTPEDTAQVPEPGTMSLMALGMAGAALFRRRRVRHHSNPL